MTGVAELWRAHRSAAFPGRLRGVDVAGVDVGLLDATVAGCVESWLSAGGEIDDLRWDVLAAAERDLERVLARVRGDEAVYVRRLLEITVLILGSSDV
jgi:hypothetical protein